MTTHPHPVSGQVRCEVCKKEVPRADAVDFEVGDYVAHFCGLECYARWKGREVPAEAGEPAPDSGRVSRQ
jgi:hypothetical protein